jgi:hypothetical protein
MAEIMGLAAGVVPLAGFNYSRNTGTGKDYSELEERSQGK